MNTSDPQYNTTAPTGDLADSGWQYQGTWGANLGTPIAEQFFITAKHVGGSVGQVFTWNSVSYTTTAYYDSAESDLRIWQVNSPFPYYAPLYSGSDELGKSLIVIGRGTRRGAEVKVNDTLKGWRWGASDGVQRWGENQVVAVGSLGAGLGDMLKATFDIGAGSNEAHLSGGDSSGAVFIQDDTTWKLAGINYGVDGSYNLTGDGQGFDAALSDKGGLYIGKEGDWTYIPDLPIDVASAFYATRISSNLNWINSVVVPEPWQYGFVTGLALLGFAVWRRTRLCKSPSR